MRLPGFLRRNARHPKPPRVPWCSEVPGNDCFPGDRLAYPSNYCWLANPHGKGAPPPGSHFRCSMCGIELKSPT